MKKTHSERKAEIAKKLQAKYVKTKDKMLHCKRVANIVGVSGMSVNNYMNGRVADGYLAEDILALW